MARTFKVGQSNELVSSGKIYDLHGHYDFNGLAVLSGGRARLWFVPNDEHGVGRSSVVIEVEGVDYLELTSGVATGKVRDVDEMGYKNPGDRDLDWLLEERASTDGDHFVLRFGPNDFLRIHGQSMALRERELSESSGLFG
ncbi:MAG TPA: hypothetical protein VF728_10050 [Nocardioides sp.]